MTNCGALKCSRACPMRGARQGQVNVVTVAISSHICDGWCENGETRQFEVSRKSIMVGRHRMIDISIGI